MQKQTITDYSNRFYNKYPDSEIKILLFLNNSRIKISNNFGECIVNRSDLLKGKIPTIESAIDKLSYVRKEYFLINPTSKIEILEYINSQQIKVKNEYGECIVSKYSLVNRNSNISINCAINKNEYFINQAKEIHGNKYDYSLVNYNGSKDKIKIICKKHGIFEQTPNKHLQTRGCRKCKYCKINNWSYSNWEKTGNNSKNFDSFKVYIIECWNDVEKFYKIGKTFKVMNKRFYSKITMPYNHKILKIFIGTAKETSELEKELQRKNNQHKYIPQKYFAGVNECYLKIK